MIASMRHHKYWMRIYGVTPMNTDWAKLVYGSPSVGLRPRFEHIQFERDRIPRYQAKGDLATYDEFFIYLASRSITR